MTPAGTRSSSGSIWCVVVALWSLVFAGLHFYWASGGRAGLGAQAVAADAALQRSWFAAYNLAAGCLGLLGAVMALVLARHGGGHRVRRWLSRAAAAASVILLVRGFPGSTLIAVSLLKGTFDPRTPAVLLAIEPWFVLGGLAYGVMALHQRRACQQPGSLPERSQRDAGDIASERA